MSNEKSTNDLRESGVISLLKKSLNLHKGELIFIIVQKELSIISDYISDVADMLEIEVELREFKSSDFFNGKFPIYIYRELEDNNSIAAVLLLIDWSSLTSGGRLNFLKKMTTLPNIWKIASMPGMQIEFLKYCNSDYKLITDYCYSVALSLQMFSKATIKTRNNTGEELILELDLGHHTPSASTGIIENGKWGNVPSGETYCLPNVKKTNGRMFLKGSIPNRPLDNEEWISIEIKNGKILYESTLASSSSLLSEFNSLFFDNSGKLLNKNNNIVAELGIGVNCSIHELTGKPLFDEKKIGTIHLGFGSNAQFNGPVKSETHHDLVFSNVEVTLNDCSNFFYEKLLQKNSLLLDREIICNISSTYSEIELGIGENASFVLNKKRIEISYRSQRNSELKYEFNFEEFYTLINSMFSGNQDSIKLPTKHKFINSQLFPKLVLNNILKIISLD